jgi:diguanylate cyclase
MDSLIEQISDSVSSAKTLEDLARPMLEMLEVVTGLESTYLTTIDLDKGLQHILFARNVRQLTIPEGLSVPWADTLCRSALAIDPRTTSVEEALRRADDAMYEVKRGRRMATRETLSA